MATNNGDMGNAVCLCADAAMMIPAMFVANSVLSHRSPNSVPFDALIVSEPGQADNEQRNWMRENGIILREEVDLSPYRDWFEPADRLSPAALTRLLLPKLLGNEYDRILYLDCDLTIHDDVSQLFPLDLEGHAFAAVRAAAVFAGGEPERAEAEAHFAELGMTRPFRYFNAGVLLIDTDAWTAADYGGRALNFIAKNRELCRLFDEDALNALADGQFCQLSPSWNSAPLKTPYQIAEERGWPVIVHHAGHLKPWRRFVRRRRNSASRYYHMLYRDFLRGTPWSDWLAQQQSLRDIGRFLEWRIAEIPRGLREWRKRQSIAEEHRRYWREDPFADVEQGIMQRNGHMIRLKAERRCGIR